MFSSILNTLSNCFKIPELKSRILFTAAVLGICRLASLVPVPGLDSSALKAYFDSPANAQNAGGFLGMYSMFTGGGFEKCAIGALGIMPYISSTIILQLLQAVIPGLSKMSREEGGRTKVIQYGRVMTLGLCIVQGALMAVGWEHAGSIFKGLDKPLIVPAMMHHLWWYRVQTTIILTTGTMMLMWLGEQITDRGIGNGISLIITIGILARLPQAGQGLVDMFFRKGANFNAFHFIALVLLLCAVVAGVVAVTQAERKIPVQYAQRVVGRKTYSGGSSFMPLRVNYSGVMPVIFASAILMFPSMILNYLGRIWDVRFFQELAGMLQRGGFVYLALYGLMILFFSYFWVATQFNELQISDDMKKSGGYIPGVRPGQATSTFLHRTMSRITLAGALFLTVIAVVPIIMQEQMGIYQTVAQFFGGTSLLIIVGVMLDTMRQMEAHLLMRHYDGFLKKGRLKGRF